MYKNVRPARNRKPKRNRKSRNNKRKIWKSTSNKKVTWKSIYQILKICLSIIKTSNTKSLWKCVIITKIIKDLIIKKEIDGNVNAYEKQLRSKYIETN